MNNLIRVCSQFSMISQARFRANIQCVETVLKEDVPGDIVEIGVWKGGSVMSMMFVCDYYKQYRTIHLFDTFSGMTPASDIDTRVSDNIHFNRFIPTADAYFHCKASIEEVKENLNRIKYPCEKINFHVGDICKNTFIPDSIAVLRLDTDFYESTRHELEQFYDVVSPGGFVIIDDYGYWNGARKAVDEWLQHHPEVTLTPIDDTGVYFQKPRV